MAPHLQEILAGKHITLCLLAGGPGKPRLSSKSTPEGLRSRGAKGGSPSLSPKDQEPGEPM